MLTEYSCIKMKSNLLWKSLSIGRCTEAPVYSTWTHQQVLPTWKQVWYCNCCSTLALQLYPSKTTTSLARCIHLQSSPGSIEIDLWDPFCTSMIIMIMGARVNIPWPKTYNTTYTLNSPWSGTPSPIHKPLESLLHGIHVVVQGTYAILKGAVMMQHHRLQVWESPNIKVGTMQLEIDRFYWYLSTSLCFARKLYVAISVVSHTFCL